jgi:hypothetical protein
MTVPNLHPQFQLSRGALQKPEGTQDTDSPAQRVNLREGPLHLREVFFTDAQ